MPIFANAGKVRNTNPAAIDKPRPLRKKALFAKQMPGRTRRRIMGQIAFLPSAESRKTKPAAMKKVLFAKQMPGRTRRRIMGQIAFLPSVESRKTKPAAMKKVLFAKQMPGRTRLPDAGPALVPPFGRPLAYASGLIVAFTTFIALASATACATPASVSGNSSCIRSQGYRSAAR